MKSPLIALLLATLIALFAFGGARWLGMREAARKPTPPVTLPLLSRVTVPSSESAPSGQQSAGSTAERSARLALEIESSLVARDPQQRETAFNFLLPELLQLEPARVVAMVARQEPGETRDALRDEVARQWITRDRDAAIKWMHSLADESERHDSATVAVSSLAASAPGEAIHVAEEFGVGRDDGYQEHLVQIWAEEDIDAATRWIEKQPAGAQTERLRLRVEQVRLSKR